MVPTNIKPLCFISRATRSTWIVVICPWPALSATRRTNRIQIRFDKPKFLNVTRHAVNKNTEANGGEGLEPMKLEREPGFSRPEPCAFLKKRARNLTCSPLLVGSRRKKTDRGQISASSSETPQFAPLILARKVQHFLGSSPIDLPSALCPRLIWCLLTR